MSPPNLPCSYLNILLLPLDEPHAPPDRLFSPLPPARPLRSYLNILLLLLPLDVPHAPAHRQFSSHNLPCSYLNILLLCLPIGIWAGLAGKGALMVFSMVRLAWLGCSAQLIG